MLALPTAAWAFPQAAGAAGAAGLDVPLQRYLWGLDTLDATEMLAAFAPRATIRDIAGKRWGPGLASLTSFAEAQVAAPAGGQHHLQINRVQAQGRRYRVESYWSRVEWQTGQTAPVLTALGSFVDVLAMHGDEWRIADRRIALWNSDTVKVAVVQGGAQ